MEPLFWGLLVVLFVCAVAYYWYQQARTVTKETLSLFKQAGELEAKRDAAMLAAQRAENELKEIKGDTEEDEVQRDVLHLDQREHTAHATFASSMASIVRRRAAVKEVNESLKRKRAKTPDKKK